VPSAERIARATYATKSANLIKKNEEAKAPKVAKPRKRGTKKKSELAGLGEDKDEASTLQDQQQTIRKKKAASDIVADPNSSFPHLPQRGDWDDCFQRGRGWQNNHHFFVGSEDTVEAVTLAMELDRRAKAAGRKLTILEGYTGPGTMTRRFLNDDNVEKVIAMEDHPSFFPWLKVRLFL